MRTLEVNLNSKRWVKDINRALEEAAFRQMVDIFLKRLADMGMQEASARFSAADFDSDTGGAGVGFSITRMPNGYIITAYGSQAVYVEFGAGITFNGGVGSYNYPKDPPPEIDPIGMHPTNGKSTNGLSGGANPKGWRTPSGRHTYGIPAQMPMYNASKKMRENIERVAREVFGNV